MTGKRNVQRLAAGDVVEIETPQGLAYALVSHLHPAYPPVVRVFSLRHRQRPSGTDTILASPVAFMAMVPLDEILAGGALVGRVIDNLRLPAAMTGFPGFVTPIYDRAGVAIYWWLWDGVGLTFTTALDPDQATWPRREVVGAREFLGKLHATGQPAP